LSTTKEELVAASIREQITYLEGLLKELESQSERDPLFLKRIRDVETQLRKLCTQL
jgi:hypothetical protein